MGREGEIHTKFAELLKLAEFLVLLRDVEGVLLTVTVLALDTRGEGLPGSSVVREGGFKWS